MKKPPRGASRHCGRSAAVLVVILLVQLAVCSWFAVNKAGLFQDESYTFFLANGWWHDSVPADGVVYQDGEPWRTWGSVDTFLGVNFDKLYQNQASDNHPPLYYFFFSLAYSLFPGSVNPIIGVALNIVFALITTVELYVLCRTLRAPRPLSLLLCAFWAINPAMVNCMLYLRMYQLLAVFFLGAAIVSLKCLAAGRIGFPRLLLLFAVTAGGFLTQYFFVFFAFVLYLCIGVTLLARRRIFSAAGFACAGIGGVLAGMALFPPSIDHLFSSFRGQEALEHAASGDTFGPYLVEDMRLLNAGVFGYLLPIILVVAFLLLIVSVVRRRKAGMGRHMRIEPQSPDPDIWWRGVGILAVSSLCYVVLVARVAPYASIRYLMAVNAVLMLWPYLLLTGAASRVRWSHTVWSLVPLLVCAVVATASGYAQGIKYFDQETDSVAALSEKNDAMVAIWQDYLFLQAVLPDAQSYDEAVYFSSPETFESFDFSRLPSEFTLYIQPGVDFGPYQEFLDEHACTSMTYVGETIDHYSVYDVQLANPQ